MGLFAHWVCVRGPADALREAGFGDIVETETRGWLMGYPDEDARLPEWEELDDLVVGVAASAGGPALGSWVYDGDVGYLAAADEDGEIARVVINAEGAVDMYGVALPEDWPDGAIAGFARWSNGAPRALETAAIAEVVGRHWILAEEGVQELHERLGLSMPYEAEPEAELTHGRERATVETIDAGGLGGYEAPLPWITEAFVVGDRRIPWREARHVPGVGMDFIGIWDRESPQEPIARFRRSARGESEAMDELHRLQEPLRRAEVGGDELGGFEHSLNESHMFDLLQRYLLWKVARYVAGYGSDFVGVWDRNRPEAPIERFPADRRGFTQAYMAVHHLLFEDVLARKELPGLRLFLPRIEPRLVEQHISPDFLDHVHGLNAKRRAAWEEDLKRGGLMVRTAPGPWLLTEEDPDENWSPAHFGGRFFVYVRGLTGTETEDELDFLCQGNFPTEQHAREAASRQHAEGEWRPVPDDVPRNLLATVRWLFANA